MIGQGLHLLQLGEIADRRAHRAKDKVESLV
jgi:hypothetical protein